VPVALTASVTVCGVPAGNTAACTIVGIIKAKKAIATKVMDLNIFDLAECFYSPPDNPSIASEQNRSYDGYASRFRINQNVRFPNGATSRG
jgi:hypothetical protein